MAWLHNIEVKREYIEALETYCQNTGANRREALEFALSHLPTFGGLPELPGWAAQIQEGFIAQSRPFALNYRDASDRTFGWTVRYAQFTTYEKRVYLDFWADETEGNQDIEPLRHNWSVRLDRVVSIDPIPVEGEWRLGLDTIDVEFYLYGGLSYAYAKETGGLKPDDIATERLDANTRKVTRRISNTFWFVREIACYWDDCRVIRPDSVRAMVLAKGRKMLEGHS
jgi:hypothetical protein